jgi:methionine sulfoxide reductase heme-binding subunit
VHLTSSPVDWYAARAAGVVAYVLLSVIVVLGMTMAGKKKLHRWPRFAVEDVHRFGGILVGTFVVIHIVTIAVDAWLPFSLASIIVPFTSAYKPIWVGLGIVAAELLLALAVTNRLRHTKISYRFWRRAHYLNFAVWGTATLHGLGSGTDRATPWLMAIEAASIALVVSVSAWRALSGRLDRVRLRGVSVAGAVGLAALAVFLVRGPLSFHPKPWNGSAFEDRLSGQVQQQLGVTKGIVSFAGQASGDQRVLVRADLLIGTKSLLSTAFQMEYLPSGQLCTGAVTKTQAYGFTAHCRTRNGATRLVTASWRPASGTPTVNGELAVSGAPA